MPSVKYAASWRGKALADYLNELSASDAQYNSRAMEMLCCNQNGMTVECWYAMSLISRTYKVAAMIMPNLLSLLQYENEATATH